MANISPSLKMKVENTLEKDGSEFSLDLEFKSMEDFEPHKIVNTVEPLKNLMDTRNKLRDLLTKADRSEELENILEEILSNSDALSSFSDELGVSKDDNKGEQ
jgi:type VI secretion system protein ImpB